MTKHTALPWTILKPRRDGRLTGPIHADVEVRIIADERRRYGTIALCPPHAAPLLNLSQVELDAIAHANAEFIVRACNAHNALVKALQAMLDIDDWTDDSIAPPATVAAARAALAQAAKPPERKKRRKARERIVQPKP